jgi:TusA-related sulfurtransferase
MSATDKKLDARGLFCPEPVFRTKIEVEKMQVGETLTVLADDPNAEEDISRWVKRTGHELLSFQKRDSELEFSIKKVK